MDFFFCSTKCNQISTPNAHRLPNRRIRNATCTRQSHTTETALCRVRASGDNDRVLIDNRKRARVREAVGLVLIGLLILIIAIVRYHRVVDWHVR